MHHVSESTSPRRRLLVVDDHDDSRNLLVRLLSTSYDVSSAKCYDTALAQAAQARPDLVISDFGLPGRDGLTLMRELKRLYGVCGICVSGTRLEDLNDTALRDAGFVGHLLKPIHFDKLLLAVASLCGKQLETVNVG